MTHRWRYAALFILLLLTALLLQWPAAALSSHLENQSNGQWRLTNPRGTLWQGGGLLLLRMPGNRNGHRLIDLNWRIRPGELLRGRLSIDLEPEQGQLRLIATPDGLHLESLNATLPANALIPLLPGALGRYHWEGQLQARSAAFSCDWSAQNCQGHIEILWDNAAIAEVSGPALGHYRLNLTGNGPALKLAIDTREGRLQLQADGEITHNGHLHLQGEASAPTKTGDLNDESLNALLTLLMRPQGAGRYRIDYRDNSRSGQ
jgi:hypothetical protein